MAFLPVWDKGEEQEATAQIPLVAAAKMGFLAEWASLRTRRGVRSMGVCSRGTCRAGLCELSRQKGCLVSSVLQDSVLLWLFKVQRKENWRQPKGGASRMQGSHTEAELYCTATEQYFSACVDSCRYPDGFGSFQRINFVLPTHHPVHMVLFLATERS